MTNKLEISRELAEQILSGAPVKPKLDDYCCVGCGNWMPVGHPEAHEHEEDCPEEAAAKLRHWTSQLRAILAAPVVERQEPVAEVQHGPFDDVGAPQWVRVVTLGDFDLEHLPDGTKFYTSQPAPIAVLNIRNFANAMIDIALEGADADGGHIQELAIKHGLLKPEQRTERCGDTCSCAEYADFPVECFRKVKELNQ